MSNEVIDLSKSLYRFGWRGNRKRGCIEKKIIAYANFNDQYSYDDGDGESFIMERWRRFGLNRSTYQIESTRRYMCNTCNVVLPTYHAVLCHVNDDSSSSLNNVDHDADNEKFLPNEKVKESIKVTTMKKKVLLMMRSIRHQSSLN